MLTTETNSLMTASTAHAVLADPFDHSASEVLQATGVLVRDAYNRRVSAMLDGPIRPTPCPHRARIVPLAGHVEGSMVGLCVECGDWRSYQTANVTKGEVVEA